MGLFGRKYPYSNFHEINLDWIIETLKKIENTSVLSVNGQTGEVVLYQDPNVVFPEVESSNWTITRTAGGHEVGLQLQGNMLFLRYDGNTNQVYTHDSPPPYPVTSVDGMTGAVTTMPNAATRLPDVPEAYTNIRRQIGTGTPDQAIVGIQVEKDKAYRMQNQQRLQLYDSANQPPYPVSSVNGRVGEVTGLYDASNPPPYPVTSVNGKTGVVTIAIPITELSQGDAIWVASQASPGNTAGMVRGTAAGPVSLWLDGSLDPVSGDHIAAYISWTDPNDDTNVVTQKLLTNADIPSGAGVISINGLTGVVTLSANNILYNSTDTIKDKLDDVDDTTNTLSVDITKQQKAMSYIVNGNVSADSIPAGAYFQLINSTISGRIDGEYTASQAIPANTAIDSTYFNESVPISGGAVNALNSNLNDTTNTLSVDIAKQQKAMSYVVNGNVSTDTIPAGAYFQLINSTISGRIDGEYTASQAIPANTAIDSTYFNETSPISGGVANALNNKIITDITERLGSKFYAEVDTTHQSVEGLVTAIKEFSTSDIIICRVNETVMSAMCGTTVSYGGPCIIMKASSNNAYFMAFSRSNMTIGNLSLANNNISAYTKIA